MLAGGEDDVFPAGLLLSLSSASGMCARAGDVRGGVVAAFGAVGTTVLRMGVNAERVAVALAGAV